MMIMKALGKATRFKSTNYNQTQPSLPVIKTCTLDRRFIPTAVRLYNSFPVHVVGNISDKGLQAFKYRVQNTWLRP